MDNNTHVEPQILPAFFKKAQQGRVKANTSVPDTTEEGKTDAANAYDADEAVSASANTAIGTVASDVEQRKSVTEIKRLAKELADKAQTLEKKSERSKGLYASAKDKHQETVLALIAMIYEQHLLYLVSPTLESGQFLYKNPLKDAISRSSIKGKRRAAHDNPFLDIVKLALEDCTAKNQQAAWTRNNKVCNVLIFIDRSRHEWTDSIVAELVKRGGRDKVAALGAKLRKEQLTGTQGISNANEQYIKKIESLIAACPIISANQLAAGDTSGLDDLTIAFVRRVEGEPAHLIPLPSSCSEAANKAMAKILVKVGGANGKA